MKNILITDDEIMNLKMTEFILKKTGYSTSTASSGAECIEAVKAKRPDLILLDLLMPEMNGFETIEKLRKCNECRNIPIILLTAAEDSETIEKAEKTGVCGCIGKPFRQNVLLDKISAVIGS